MSATVTVEPWTDEQCLLLEPTWQLCQARREAHNMAFRFYNKWHNVVSLPPILVGAVLSTLSLNPDTVPAGANAALAIFMTGMSTVGSFFNLAKTQEGHRQTYRNFNLLAREIEMSILRGRETPKRSFVDFLEYVNERFTKLVEDAPTLNAAARVVLDAYRKERPSPFSKLLGEQKDNECDASTTIQIHNTGSQPVVNNVPAASSVSATNSAIIALNQAPMPQQHLEEGNVNRSAFTALRSTYEQQQPTQM